MLGVTRNWASTVVNWNLALDPTGGPHNGGCDTCTGVVTVEPAGTVTRNAEYYTLGHLARFVRPGAHRSRARRSAPPAGTAPSWTPPSATPTARSCSSRTTRTTPRATFAVAQGGSSFDYTLPGGALATFVWPSSAALDDGHRLLDLHGATASASEGADAGKPSTTTRSPAGPPAPPSTPGQTLTVDLHATRNVGRVALDTGALTEADVNWGPGQPSGDYPRGLLVSTSTDGTTWSAPVTATGSAQITTVDLPGGPARYVRLEQTGTTGPGGRSPTSASTPDRLRYEALVDGVTNGGFTTRNRAGRPRTSTTTSSPSVTDGSSSASAMPACGSARTCRW